MRPFGNDITNISNNNGAGNGEDRSNGNGNGNNNGNDNADSNSNANSSDTNDLVLDPETDPRIPPHIARIGGIVTFSPIAGRGVIRVVRRCEDAKENHKLGKFILVVATKNNQELLYIYGIYVRFPI